MSRTLKCVIAAGTFLLVQLCCVAGALAQQAQPAEGAAEGKSYILAYVLVMFVIALGMLAVARPGGRDDRPRMPEQDLEQRLKQMTGRK